MKRSQSLWIVVTFMYNIMASKCAVFTESEQVLIDNFIESMMQCRKIPGLGLAVVKGEEVFTKGYGFADLRTRRAFDDRTVSCVGSSGKSMTVALLAVLMTEKRKLGEKIDWDTTFKEILGPKFELPGDFRTDKMTLIDALSHRTGLGTTDLLLTSGFPTANTSKKELSWRLKYLPIAAPLRDKFIYNNMMYMFAGYIAEVLGRKPFKELIYEKIFQPLDMNSITYIDDMYENDNAALPYQLINGSLVDSDKSIYKLREFIPAGAMSFSAKDNAKWLKFILAKGKTSDGTQLIDPELFSTIFEPHVAVSLKSYGLFKPLPVSQAVTWYGLAWYGASYRGYHKRFHGGNWFAYSAKSAIYPDHNVGMFITVNGPWPITGSKTYHQLAHFLSDILLKETPWLNSSTICTYPEPWLRKREPKPPTELPAFRAVPFLDQYTGIYGHPLYGDMLVITQNEQIFLSVGYLLKGFLRPLENSSDTFLLDMQAPLSTAIKVNPKVIFLNKKGNTYNEVKLDYRDLREKFMFYRNVKFSDNSLHGNVASGGVALYCRSYIFLVVNFIVANKAFIVFKT